MGRKMNSEAAKQGGLKGIGDLNSGDLNSGDLNWRNQEETTKEAVEKRNTNKPAKLL